MNKTSANPSKYWTAIAVFISLTTAYSFSNQLVAKAQLSKPSATPRSTSAPAASTQLRRLLDTKQCAGFDTPTPEGSGILKSSKYGLLKA